MQEPPPDQAHWSRFAHEWVQWTRTPNHDAFWAYREAFLSFIGRGKGGEALEVGCGEGRISRELAALGYRVSAADVAPEMIEAARELGSASEYAVAPAAALPFADGRFRLVVAYNVLMDVEDVPASIREIRRVLRPDGEFVFSLVHPFSDRGDFDGAAADAPFTLKGSYFGRERFEAVEQRNGLTMHFAGWSQPLEAYAAALEAAGLAITSIREPRPAMGEGREYLERWQRIPLFLWVKARPLAVA
ncbi:MAG TPA: class I SAM-dependent methyltransferase [Chthoniobacteraceae bacterium]|nr:class I SAM-dependent methyltransferase [Chthoniobacteraceae bacterium]